MSTYIHAAEAAKMIRKDLKLVFPTVKFSVRTKQYSGGSSIRIEWTDGPVTKMVEAIAHRYDGRWSDGMTDYYGHNESQINGERVHFMASVSCSRDESPEVYARGRSRVLAWYGLDATVDDHATYVESAHDWLTTLIWRETRRICTLNTNEIAAAMERAQQLANISVVRQY